MCEKQKHILIVDEEPAALQELLELLSEVCTVSITSSAAAALELLPKMKPDLILTNTILPDGDGFIFVGNIRSIPSASKVPIIFLTTQTEEALEIKGLESGASDYIKWPCSPRIVLLRVKKQLAIVSLTPALTTPARIAHTILFSDFFMHHSAPILLVDAESGKIEDGNPSAVAFYGYSYDELTTLNITSINSLPANEVEAIRHAATAGRTPRFIVQHRLKDGAVRIVDVFSSVIMNQGRKILAPIIFDITEQYLAKQALEASEENFSTLFNTIDYLLLVLDRHGNFIKVNQATVNTLEYTADELAGKNIIQFHPPQVRGKVAELLHAMMDNTPSVSFSVTIQKKDGTPLPVDVSTFLGSWAAEPAFFCIMKDLSSLRTREQQYQQLFAEMLCAMMVCEVIYDEFGKPKSFRLIHINPAAEQMLGVSRHACLHKTREEFSWGWPEAVVQQYYAVAETGEPLSYVRHNLKFGGYFDTKVFAPRKGQFALLFLDISDQVISEKKMMVALQEAERANKEQQNFYSTVAHEFRTPLTLISVSTGILRQYADRITADEADALNEQIDKAIAQLSSLIESVLNASSSEHTKSACSPVMLDINVACSSIANGMRIMFGNSHRFEVLLDTDCGQILCDEMLFRQVVENLLVNAFRYTPDNGTIQLAAQRTGTRLIITIQDTGIGVPEQDLPRIKEAFYRGSNVSRGSGLGLGLSVVCETLKRMQGTLKISSTLAKGTTVTVELPLDPAQTEDNL